MTDLELAAEIAERAHAGQKDRVGVPYINHPRAVAEKVRGDTAKTVAMLHDVVEDTPITLESLRVLFGDEISDAVGLLTHEEGTLYMDYVAAIRGNDLAVEVKLADLAHNSDLSRLGHEPTKEDMKRLQKYEAARALLTGGNA